jgi:hypothetical protein
MIEKLIKVKYQFKEHKNVVLSKFFKTEEQVNSFKEHHPDYIYLN